jgi:hypothetical protein
MDKKDLKEIMSVFKPMNEYYSLLLKEKQSELFDDEFEQDLLKENFEIVKNGIKKYNKEIVLNFESTNYNHSNLFSDIIIFLQRKNYIEFDANTYDLWVYAKNDFKLLDMLDEIIKKIANENQKQIDSFIKKYTSIAQQEQAKEKYIAVDNTWLNGKLFINKETLPVGLGITVAVCILKSKLRIPNKKVRVGIKKSLRLEIAKRDDWKCQHCNVDLSAESSAWEINHIDKNPSNNDLINLELTCRTCNKKWGG